MELGEDPLENGDDVRGVESPGFVGGFEVGRSAGTGERGDGSSGLRGEEGIFAFEEERFDVGEEEVADKGVELFGSFTED